MYEAYVRFKAVYIWDTITFLKPFKHSQPVLNLCLYTEERANLHHRDIFYMFSQAKNQSHQCLPALNAIRESSPLPLGYGKSLTVEMVRQMQYPISCGSITATCQI